MRYGLAALTILLGAVLFGWPLRQSGTGTEGRSLAGVLMAGLRARNLATARARWVGLILTVTPLGVFVPGATLVLALCAPAGSRGLILGCGGAASVACAPMLLLLVIVAQLRFSFGLSQRTPRLGAVGWNIPIFTGGAGLILCAAALFAGVQRVLLG